MAKHGPDGLIARFKAATNAFDADIAHHLGMPRATVQAYACGRAKERLSEAQRATLVDLLRQHVEHASEMLEELELLA